MNLGAFSLSLAVKDIEASRDFYQRLGFAEIGGNVDDKWLILRNGDRVLGLFEGMFDKNMLTFNPGWDQHGNDLDTFTDVRDLQQQLAKAGVQIVDGADPSGKGPASFMVTDPDGNPILVDQHR